MVIPILQIKPVETMVIEEIKTFIIAERDARSV